MQLSPDNTSEAIERCIQARQVPYVQSSPGVGKSQIMKAVAKKWNLKLIDYRLATADPTDLQGFPQLINNLRMGFAPPVEIPLATDPLPKDENGNTMAGWFIFFDELGQAYPSIQNASFKIIHDKMVGQHKLHDNVAMGAAGNLESDKAHTQKLSSALTSRLIKLEMVVSNDDWDKWAIENGIDYRIRAFIQWKPDMLHNFKKIIESKADSESYACPRTWEFGSKLMHNQPNEVDAIGQALLHGAVGKSAASMFAGFSALFEKLIKYDAILKDPHNAAIPTEPSILHAVSALISHDIHLNTVPDIMPYVERLPVEFQVFALRDAIKKKPSLLNEAALADWKNKYIDRLY